MNAEQIRAAIAAAMQVHDADGLLMEEISEALGLSIHTTRARVRTLVNAGVMEHAGHRMGHRVDGVAKRSPVYRLVAS